jgi:hypothetical protein
MRPLGGTDEWSAYEHESDRKTGRHEGLLHAQLRAVPVVKCSTVTIRCVRPPGWRYRPRRRGLVRAGQRGLYGHHADTRFFRKASKSLSG